MDKAVSGIMQTNRELAKELAFLRAKASKYAFWGTLIASASVIVATALVSYFMVGNVTLDGVMLGQRSNIALWVLDAMPFIFATWGQYASVKMADEASAMVHDKTADLRQALDDVKLNAQAKSDFFSKISHELRSPLNGVIGMVDMLLETKLDKEQQRYANVVRSSAHGLLNIINDILDFSKIEAGKLALEEIEFDLRECIEGCVALMLPQARVKNLTLAAHIPLNVPQRLVGDPGRLRQIVMNLMSNALKFTERGQIVLSVSVLGESEQHAHLRIEVTDTGIGMSAATLQQIFQPYQQGSAATARQYGGTGLGLVISKELVETMHGEIGVSSAEGQGSTFWFSLPLAKPKARTAIAVATDVELRGLHALVADDNTATRTALAKQLRRLGVEVEEVGDGIAALQMLLVAASTGYRFDLVITDMFLPCMNGEELGREIKSRDATQDTVLLMMTAVGQRGDAQRVHQLGFAAYVKKPVANEGLADLLRAAMATRKMSEEQRRHSGLVTKYSLAKEREAKERQALRLLLADDSAVNREIMHSMLAKMGHTVHIARDGKEAIEIARTRAFDAILMDLQMPVLDGFSAIQAIRASTGVNSRAPIVALTAGVTDTERQRCLAEGANAVLLKPTTTADMTATLARVLARSETTTHLPATATQRTQTLQPPNVAKIFVAETEQRLAALQRGIDDEDIARVSREAHTLKGASAHFNAQAMRNAAIEIEQLAARGDLKNARAPFAKLQEAFKSLQAQLASNAPAQRLG